MVLTDFAPNERADDAWVALGQLFTPWRLKRGKKLGVLKTRLKSFFPDHTSFLFLSARAALYQVLQSLPLNRGDEVLVQAFTCEAVVLPILAHGMLPVYVDIETASYSMDMEDLIKKVTPRARVLILQHSFGITPLNRQTILEWAKARRLTVIEDMAHGFERELFKKDKAITTKLLSFGRSKMVSSVWGGAVVTPSRYLSERLRGVEKRLAYPSTFFIVSALWYKPLSVIIKTTYNWLYLGRILHMALKVLSPVASEITPKERGGTFDNALNKAYPNALAAVLLHQIKKFDQISEIRSQSTKMYDSTLGQKYPNQVPHLTTSNFALLRYPFLVDNRPEVLKKARRKGIYLGKWYDQVIAPRGIPLGQMQYKPGSCPTAEGVCNRIINLPTQATDKQVSRVINLLK
jgi:dTDP-4-amino-4,6-dideoxygalactose transaminase